MKPRILMLLGIVLISLGLLVACTTQEDVELARMRRADAEARLASAQALGTVNVIQAETDSHVQKLRTETDITKEMRQFDADLARQEYATALLEVQALQIALQETREIIEPISDNTFAAAENSLWTLILLPIGLGVVLVCVGGLMYHWNQETVRRLEALEGKLNNEQDAAAKG